MARLWYSFDGFGSPYTLSSYRRTTAAPGCVNGPLVCAIYAEFGGEHPRRLSPNLIEYIANGLSNNVAEPALPPQSKFFVYMKGSNI
jgi:hypothetical protein